MNNLRHRILRLTTISWSFFTAIPETQQYYLLKQKAR